MDLTVIKPGTVPYGEALELQYALHKQRADNKIGDTLLLLEHPPVITMGKRAGDEDLLVSRDFLVQAGVDIFEITRGGEATYHGPGQLVGYFIADIRALGRDVDRFVSNIEQVIIDLLTEEYGIAAGRDPRHRGVWVGNEKIAAVGIAIREGVSMHGFAFNVNTDLSRFSWIIPCGITDRGVTSLQQLTGKAQDLDALADSAARRFAEVYGYGGLRPGGVEAHGAAAGRYGVPGGGRKPPWIKIRAGYSPELKKTEDLLKDLHLHTVCDEATCPNRAECFGKGTATVMILGDVCTRNCTFCDVRGGKAPPPDPDEPEHVAEAAARMGLKHAVITSVTRDDLPDGGAGHFTDVIRALKRRSPETLVEVLIPDFLGSRDSLGTVLAAGPDVLNHNLETVPRLYPEVRPEADFGRSLELLKTAKEIFPDVLTKSGIMLGLGERKEEVIEVFHALREVRCDLLTVGQYLSPSKSHHPVVEYIYPEIFEELKNTALSLGFRAAASAPFVRSSYNAAELLR